MAWLLQSLKIWAYEENDMNRKKLEEWNRDMRNGFR